MASSNSGFMPGSDNDQSNISTTRDSSGITDKVKNLVTPESHAAGMMGMGGMGGLGGSAAASALGSNVPSMPSHSGGMSKVDSPNVHAYNRDSSHSGFGGHNPASDIYGRDTIHSETYGRTNANQEGNDYSMSSDRDRLRHNMNVGARGTGNMTSTGLGTSDLGTNTGSLDSSNIRHQAVDADSHLRTNTTRTGANSGSGIHAQQYFGPGGASTVSGMASGTGQNDLHLHHHLHGQGGTGKPPGCSMCHPSQHSMRDPSSTTTSMPASSQERMSMGGSMGKFETSNAGMAQRQQHEGGFTSGSGIGNTHNISSQGMDGVRSQHPASGPVGSNLQGQQSETGKVSMTDKITGRAERAAGKMTGNPDLTKEGEMRATSNAAEMSRN